MYQIPVTLILFRRSDTIPRIISRLREVQPQKMYLLADEGRNEKEKKEAHYVRELVEQLIDWPCEIIKNYADENRGVYKNIGEGAKWVFQYETKAVFLEDDNLPEVSFFRFAEEMLEKYESNPEVAWICGTNYYPEMDSDVSYQFTKHLLPCGWASWGDKFLKYYDGNFDLYNKKEYHNNFKRSYTSKLFRLYQEQSIRNEIYRYRKTKKYISWDYQMLWSIRCHKLFGIVPMRNQITNIGVDEYSIHGGNAQNNIMTSRFCEIKSKPLEFPLSDPPAVETDAKTEAALEAVICPPKGRIIKSIIGSKVKHLFRQDSASSIKSIIFRR